MPKKIRRKIKVKKKPKKKPENTGVMFDSNQGKIDNLFSAGTNTVEKLEAELINFGFKFCDSEIYNSNQKATNEVATWCGGKESRTPSDVNRTSGISSHGRNRATIPSDILRNSILAQTQKNNTPKIEDAVLECDSTPSNGVSRLDIQFHYSKSKEPVKRIFSSLLVGLVTAGMFSAVMYAFALPYAPGETTNPTCSPGATDCTVTASVPYTGATSAVNLGTRALTAASLTLTTALTTANGGTGLTTIPAGSVIAANALDTFTAITSTSGTKYLKNTSGTITWAEIDLSAYVPYTGATGAVALGANTLSTTSGFITPKIYPASDSTTAIQINKADGTTNVLNVDTTNGYVGIGRTPGVLFDIKASNQAEMRIGSGTNATGAIIKLNELLDSNETDGGYLKYQSNELILGSQGSGGDAIRIARDTADVAIGPAESSVKFRVNVGTGNLSSYTGIKINDVLTGAEGSGTYTRRAFFINSDISGMSSNGADGDVYIGLHDKVVGHSDVTTYAAIFEGGNVGIGTTAPQSLLDVQGPVGTGATGAGILTLATKELTIVDGDELGRINFNAPLESDGSDAILAGASIWAEADDTFSATVNSTELVFATGTSAAATEKMRIDRDGNVGIGDTDPTNGKLVVIGGIAVGADALNNNINSASTGDGSTTLYIGNSTINVTAPSDIITKENIVSTEYGINELMKLSVKDFNYKKEIVNEGATQKEHTGMIAQDVEVVYPEAMIYRSDGLKAIDYNKLIPLIIKSVQDIKLGTTGAVSNGQITGVNTNTTSVADALLAMGATIKNGVATLQEVIAQKVRVNKIEMVAEGGDIYCTWIDKNGDWQKVKGECGNAVVTTVATQPETSDVSTVVATSDVTATSAAQQIIEQAQTAANNALETAENAVQQAVAEAVIEAKQAVKEEVKDMKEKIKEELKQEIQPPPAPVEQPVTETKVEEKKEDKQENKQESVGEIIQDAAAGLLNSIWNFIKSITEPFLKNTTASVLQNSGELKSSGLLSPQAQAFTANLYNTINKILNAIF